MYQLCISCGSICQRPRQSEARLAMWSSGGPLTEVYDASRSSSRGSQVDEATTSQPRVEPQSWPTRCTFSPAGTVSSSTAITSSTSSASRKAARPAGLRRGAGTAVVEGDHVPVVRAAPAPPAPTCAGRRGSRAAAPRGPAGALAVLADGDGDRRGHLRRHLRLRGLHVTHPTFRRALPAGTKVGQYRPPEHSKERLTRGPDGVPGEGALRQARRGRRRSASSSRRPRTPRPPPRRSVA